MSYNQILQQQNLDIRELINIANRLPAPVQLQEKTIDIKTNGSVEIIPDSGYALSKVTVAVDVPTSGTDTYFKGLVENTLTDIHDTSVTSTRNYAFYNATSLERVTLQSVTTVGTYTFSDCTNLISVDLPNLSSATGTFAFNNCTNLAQVNLPKISAVSNYTFSDCSALEKVEVGQIKSVGSYSFRRAGTTALIIRNTSSTITKLNSTNAFSDCPIANGLGYIYVYREYVEKYKAATGWSNYAEQIRAIEDYPEICG